MRFFETLDAHTQQLRSLLSENFEGVRDYKDAKTPIA